MKKFLKSFKDFAMKGNVFDMAIGVVIGGAFSKIVSSLVADVIMPLLGVITGNSTISDLKLVLKEGVVGDAGAATPDITLNYGLFLQYIFDFILISFCIFIAVKAIGRIREKLEAKTIAEKKAKEEEEKALAKEQEKKLKAREEEEIAIRREIRDLLQKIADR